eukprot:2622215-Rhodomonas_salina.1
MMLCSLYGKSGTDMGYAAMGSAAMRYGLRLRALDGKCSTETGCDATRLRNSALQLPPPRMVRHCTSRARRPPGTPAYLTPTHLLPSSYLAPAWIPPGSYLGRT